jgi:hypothetical protein
MFKNSFTLLLNSLIGAMKIMEGKNISYYKVRIFYYIHQIWRYCIQIYHHTRFTILLKTDKYISFLVACWKYAPWETICHLQDLQFEIETTVWKQKFHNYFKCSYSFLEDLRRTRYFPKPSVGKAKPPASKILVLLNPLYCRCLKTPVLDASAVHTAT